MAEITEDKIIALVTKEIRKALVSDDRKVELFSTLVEDLEADSLDMVELFYTFEEAIKDNFDIVIQVSDEDAEKVETVGDIVDLILKLSLPKPLPIS